MKYIACLMVGLILSQNAFAISGRDCVFARNNFDEDTYQRLCNSGESPDYTTEEEMASLSLEQRKALIENMTNDELLKIIRDKKPVTKQIAKIAEPQATPVSLTVNNNLPVQPAPVVHESVKDETSYSPLWFVLGILGGGAAVYYGVKR